jgi:predicted membrane-bound mannosyltransferase
VLRVARESLPNFDLPGLLHPTRWQYPPLFFLAEGAVVRVLGEGPAAFRVVSILASALLAPWAFLAARSASGTRAGVLAGLFALTLPVAHRFGAALLVDPLHASLAGAALFLFVRAEKEGRSLLPAGLLAGLAAATKYTSILLSASLAAALLAGRARHPGGEPRRRAEILAFAALALAPLLFLRGEDLCLLRAMAFWRSPPFAWGDFLRVVPAPLLLLALLAPLAQARFPRALAGAYAYLVLTLLFFLWRRQQMNWILPAAVPVALLAGHAASVWMRGRGRLPVGALLCGLLAYGVLESAREVRAYRETARVYAEASSYVAARVSPEDLVAVDALPFESPPYARYEPCDVRKECYRRARYAILVPWVFENYKSRGFSYSAWGEVRETEIRRKWTLEKRLHAGGRPAVEIYANPRASDLN